MTRLEPNILLAVSTGLGLALAVLTATTYGAGGSLAFHALLALICAGGFVALNPLLMKALKQPPRPPMIHPDISNSVFWAGVFPLVVMVAAFVPVVRPGHDYGLLVIIAAVIFGLTAESAIKARAVR